MNKLKTILIYALLALLIGGSSVNGLKYFVIQDAEGDEVNIEVIEGIGCLTVCVQDQTTEPIDALFNQSVSNFTLSADTTASTEATLNYTFEATGGHGIVVGNELLLLDVIADRALQLVVVGVATNTITIDRPIDHVFPSSTTLGRIVTSDMSILGSLVSPQIFTFRAGTAPVDITRLMLEMIDDTSMDDGKFGGIAALTNGLVLRLYNGRHKTIFNFKTNGDIKEFCYDVSYADKAPAGQFGLSSRITFGGQDKHGVVIRLSGADVLQWVVQDDLTGLTHLSGAVQGHKTQD